MKKTILITGSTDGIGKLTATLFAQAGHIIYLHGRNEDKLNHTIREIREATNNERIHGYVSDFSDLKDVKKMAGEIKNDLTQLDVLVNNAGVFNSKVKRNAEGIDVRMVVNYLAPYLLTQELLPLLNENKGARIINLSSAAQDTIDKDIFEVNKDFSERSAYGQSKLAITMWSFYLSKMFKDLVVIPVNPGSLLNTKMAVEAFGQVWSPADKGADILYNLALNEKYSSDSGKYFDNDQGVFTDAHPDAYASRKTEWLIQRTSQMI